jgi:raffinose/stachyose/melibiose transport system permease protein
MPKAEPFHHKALQKPGRALQPALHKGSWLLLYLVLTVVALLQLLPLVWLLLFSLKNNQEVFHLSPFALPLHPRWGNYAKVWTEGNIGRYFMNSVWITVAAVILTVLLASLATYALTRMKWRFRPFVLGLFMVGLMIPVHSTLIPLFNLYSRLFLKDHPLSVILSYTAFNMPVTIMILLGAYYALPREIEEASVMDGCGVNRMFFTIILPMTLSVMTTTVIINMIYNWNEFIFVNTFISSDHLKTLTVGVQNFVGQYTTDWGAIGATLVISMMPVLIAFFILSEQIMEGVTAGAVKG